MKRIDIASYSSSLHLAWKRVALIALLAITTLGIGVSLQPVASAANLEGTWSCTVPSGYVHSAIKSWSSCAGRIQYKLAVPAEGKWVCTVPNNWTYNTLSSSDQYGPCQLGASRGKALRLTAPQAGKIVCELPANGLWTYYGVSTSTTTTECRLGGGITGIRLLQPVTGVWACKVPAGFTYSKSSLVTSPSPCLGSFIYQLKKL